MARKSSANAIKLAIPSNLNTNAAYELPDYNAGTGPTIITVTRICRNGRGGPLFRVDDSTTGRTLVARSAEPLLDSCRILLRHGIAPEHKIVVHHADLEDPVFLAPPMLGNTRPYRGSTGSILSTTVGSAAKLNDC